MADTAKSYQPVRISTEVALCSLRRMAGVAAMLALHSEALSEVIFPLITSQRLLHADRNAPPLSR